MTAVSVFLCDDVAEVRELTRWYLEEADDLKVVGEAGDVVSGVERIGKLEPDVVLLDLSMPGMSGLEAIPMIRVVAPRAAIVILSGLSRRSNAGPCIALGASHFVEKRDPVDRVRVAVRAAADGVPGTEAGW